MSSHAFDVSKNKTTIFKFSTNTSIAKLGEFENLTDFTVVVLVYSDTGYTHVILRATKRG